MENEPEKPNLNDNEANNDHSTILGVSLRGWIALIVVLTICLMSGLKIDIKEPLYTLGGLIVGFYFGQNPKKTS
jgi:hypothetical protein